MQVKNTIEKLFILFQPNSYSLFARVLSISLIPFLLQSCIILDFTPGFSNKALGTVSTPLGLNVKRFNDVLLA